jgi:hypothetical protein
MIISLKADDLITAEDWKILNAVPSLVGKYDSMASTIVSRNAYADAQESSGDNSGEWKKAQGALNLIEELDCCIF